MWQRQAVRHGRQFIRHVVPAVIKPARTLWNEVIGFLFLCFAAFFGFKAVQLVRDLGKATGESATGNLIWLLMSGFCTVVMGWYGVSSFLRARKISRS